MSVAVDITAPRTALEFRDAGVEFRRNEYASIVAMRGPRPLCAAAAAEVARRIELMRAIPRGQPRVIVSPAPMARWGKCMCCGDRMESHRGGDCELCAAAITKLVATR